LFTAGSDVTMPIAIYGTFAVEIHPNLFAFGVLTTLFSFAILAVYGILMSISVRRAQLRTTGLQEEIG
ncbi:MAG: ABC transporter permease, partial [Geminicoccaceae bacterium]